MRTKSYTGQSQKILEAVGLRGDKKEKIKLILCDIETMDIQQSIMHMLRQLFVHSSAST